MTVLELADCPRCLAGTTCLHCNSHGYLANGKPAAFPTRSLPTGTALLDCVACRQDSTCPCGRCESARYESEAVVKLRHEVAQYMAEPEQGWSKWKTEGRRLW